MPEDAASSTDPTDTSGLTRLFDVSGRVAIVTGASAGLGDRFARVLHASGAIVVAAARRAEKLEALAADLGDRLVPLACDVTDPDDRAELVDAAVEAGGQVDILVNNAGISNVVAAEDETLDDWNRVIGTNLTATFALSQLAARDMLKREKGSIVNVASILGLAASWPVKQPSYSASKGAIINLTRELGCQWARKGVRVNALAPGWIRTEMAGPMFEEGPGGEHLRRNCPMGRGGEPHELDGALLFLASDASSYMTGATLTVDGGWIAH